MDKKNQRLTAITEIIQSEHVTSQEQLLTNLNSQGFNVTQATLSRDLKLLKVAKMPDADGDYRYIILENSNERPTIRKIGGRSTLDGFISLEVSGNIGVIKTVPAFSHTISSAIDSIQFQTIISTIAGDDTIFFVIRAGFNEQQVRNELIKEFPDLIDKLI